MEPVQFENSNDESTPVGWILDSIQLENFKSYGNCTSITKLEDFPFIAIVGPNGSGKSNLMDAISFVMGERTASFRVRKLDELIHGASIGKPVANTASVSAVFKRINKDDVAQSQGEITFSRMIRGAGSEYLINKQVVSQQAYFDALKNIGINVKGRNFLVFQGAIESIALKNAKERTTLLEEICGSITMKSNYEHAKIKMNEADKKIETAYSKKKAILIERKEVRMKVQEAKCYNELLKEMGEKETEIAMFKLRNLEVELQHVQNKHYEQDRSLKKGEDQKQKLEEELLTKKKELGDLKRDLTVQESRLQMAEKEKSKLMPKLIEKNQKLKHLQKRLESAQKSLKQANENKLNHEQDLEQLRSNLKVEMEKKQAYLQLHVDTQLAEEFDITLRDSQLKEYCKLKQSVLKQTVQEKSHIEELTVQKKDKDAVFNSLNMEKTDLEGKLEILDHGIKEENKLAGKVTENITELKKLLQSKEAEAQPLGQQIRIAENNIDSLRQELEKISLEIETARSCKHKVARQNKKKEVITTLKSNFTGVYGRVVNLCKIIHPKYHLAVTKIIGSNMEAIVVDTAKTARQCIQYLQEQMIEPEVFLPIDLLQVKPLRSRFRELKDQGISLVYDLLDFSKDVEQAILHCTKNAVVCPTLEIARKVAAGKFCNEAVNAVSLEGTMYSSNGTISSGVADLQRKAQRWNDSSDEILNQKEDQKIKIQEDLKEALKVGRNAVKMQALEQEIIGINNRLKYADLDLKVHVEAAEDLKTKKKQLESEKRKLEGRWTKAKDQVSVLIDQLKSFERTIDQTEDKVFADFCLRIGIPNIRAYEEKDVRAHEEFNREKQELENKILQIKVQIEDELSQQRTLIGNISRWENALAEINKNLVDSRSEEEVTQLEMKTVEMTISSIQKQIQNGKQAVNLKTKEAEYLNKQLVGIDKLIVHIEKAKTRLKSLEKQLKLQRHELYIQCKLSGTHIPFRNGSLDDIYVEASSTGVESGSRSSGNLEEAIELENAFQVDFQGLSDELKGVEANASNDVEAKLAEELEKVNQRIRSFQAPNLKAGEELESINDKARQQEEEFKKINLEARQARKAFEEIKKARLDRFMSCYEKVSGNIDGIYKSLTQNDSAQAILGLDNPDEPYLEGVSYHCVAPGKRFQSMNNLSGGEKTLAALALLFAIQSYEPAPFLVLDEIDAALDNTNIGKVTSYIRQKSRNLQVLIISLKEEFFKDADALIGVAPDIQPSDCARSKVFTLDLTKYLCNSK